jgi:hypothetical protein
VDVRDARMPAQDTLSAGASQRFRDAVQDVTRDVSGSHLAIHTFGTPLRADAGTVHSSLRPPAGTCVEQTHERHRRLPAEALMGVKRTSPRARGSRPADQGGSARQPRQLGPGNPALPDHRTPDQEEAGSPKPIGGPVHADPHAPEPLRRHAEGTPSRAARSLATHGRPGTGPEKPRIRHDLAPGPEGGALKTPRAMVRQVRDGAERPPPCPGQWPRHRGWARSCRCGGPARRARPCA